VKPAKFGYFRPETAEEAVALLGAHAGAQDGAQDGARVLAGGQSLVPLLNRRLVRPRALVDVTRLPGLRGLAVTEDTLRIGALTRHADIETVTDPAVHTGFPILPESARWVAFPPIRSRGTFGGSIAHADPCSEWCLLAVLLDAQLIALGPAGTRVLDAAGFFTGRHRTALAPDELLVEVRFAHRPVLAALAEYSIRQRDYAVVAAAAAIRLDRWGAIAEARIALGGVADRPVRVPNAEKALLGAVAGAEAFEFAARVAAEDLEPPADVHGSAEYRRELASTLVARALRQAQAKGGPQA
jgi:carbon-monoxide dehydrogenase medium subunit